MGPSRLDHLVVAALDLEQGADYVEELLGVRVPDGGRHVFMGTHNKVMSLGDSVYLEIIAVCPDIAPPSRPRWFGLDDPAVIASLEPGPRLINWAINTGDLDQLVKASLVDVGQIQEAERDDLRWRVGITDDGRSPAAGCIPLCLEWMMDFHPSSRMQDLGCRLERLEFDHCYPGWLSNCLTAINAQNLVRITQPASGYEGCTNSATIRAVLRGPNGRAVLESTIDK